MQLLFMLDMLKRTTKIDGMGPFICDHNEAGCYGSLLVTD